MGCARDVAASSAASTTTSAGAASAVSRASTVVGSETPYACCSACASRAKTPRSCTFRRRTRCRRERKREKARVSRARALHEPACLSKRRTGRALDAAKSASGLPPDDRTRFQEFSCCILREWVVDGVFGRSRAQTVRSPWFSRTRIHRDQIGRDEGNSRPSMRVSETRTRIDAAVGRCERARRRAPRALDLRRQSERERALKHHKARASRATPRSLSLSLSLLARAGERRPTTVSLSLEMMMMMMMMMICVDRF